ncbi:MAG: hypothetical protein OEZ43_15215 [Gammaproteobacteria bacterium]|nr:hypothetical protein [Gammaproteobacteria bacterium]
MTRKVAPIIGQWYRESGRLHSFRVTDLLDDSVEIEYQDGEVEQISLEDWTGAHIAQVAEPEDMDSFRETFDLDEPGLDSDAWDNDNEYREFMDYQHVDDD